VTRKPRILIGKIGLDGHDVGARVVAKALADAGMEVIYEGLYQSPEEVVVTAVQEDVDVIGLSILSGAHNTLFPRIMELLRKKELTDVMVFAGGIIPEEDIQDMKKLGIKEIFGPGTPTNKIIEFVFNNIPERS